MNKCPKCEAKLLFEDHSIIGGDSEYWSCSECNEEKIMFGKKSQENTD